MTTLNIPSSQSFVFIDINPSNSILTLPSGKSVQADGQGSIAILIHDSIPVTLTNVLLVEDFQFNLLSVSQLGAHGVFEFKQDHADFYFHGEFLFRAPKQDNLFVVPFSSDNKLINERIVASVQKTVPEDINLLHRRFAHPGLDALIQTAKEYNIIPTGELKPCDICVKAKMTRSQFPSREIKARKAGERIHADLAGPVPTPYFGGCRFLLIIVDEYSGMGHVSPLRQKSDAELELRNFIEFSTTQHRHSPKVFHSDNGGEFTSAAFLGYLKSKGILGEYTAPNSPQSNGRAERRVRLIFERVRALLF